MTQARIPLTSPAPGRNPAPVFHISAEHHEVIALLGMGDLQAGLIALLDAGLKRTPPAVTLRRNLAMYHRHKKDLVPRSIVCQDYGVPAAYLNKVIHDCEQLEALKSDT